ncbi:type IV-A pilus assembly ATPase PilB [Amphibiibacter pelophylacis]|uniref:Type IV-A pilus assembly ATPase PilB n=1 Tax=Amphibiibacter pelophylacis TaxID=1799477 RepID=A0ACC6P3Y9_9BURK
MLPPDSLSSAPSSATAPASLTGAARVLVHAGLLDETRALQAQAEAQAGGTDLLSVLLQHGWITAAAAAHGLSQTLSLPLLDLDALSADRLPRHLIDSRLAERYRLLALGRRGNTLFVAGSDPTDREVVQRLKFTTQLLPEWVVVEHDKLLTALRRQQEEISSDSGSIAEVQLEELGGETSSQSGAATVDARVDADDAPVVRFLQKMLVDAINLRASDLHFEPYEHQYRVRFRIDGELREVSNPPVGIRERLAARIKILARMDIAERRMPQDGRMKLRFGSKTVDFRISTLPTLFGEKIVIRVLDASAATLGIDSLGYEPAEKARLLDAIRRPYGMVLVTGPTGSGKTVSLYTCLNLLNKPGVNIATAEDPAEINLPGVNQVNVNERVGLTFATALRSFLRQDPDIIMVGEIRDLETADIAIKAAQTGHLVLSTLHTNDAPSTLSRLLNMGVAPFNIASSILVITAQRLARRLCERCKEPVTLPDAALLDAGYTPQHVAQGLKLYRPVGCPECNQGYKGRVGLYQVMPISPEIERIILNHGSSSDIAQQARRDGVRDLRQSGLVKAARGVTSLEEVLSVTNTA